ncbi:MAG: DUF4347 domain-containing protein [Elainellaceae cyanobacterium]
MLLFIDSSVQDSSTLLNGLVEQAEVIQLDSDQNGIKQITEALSSRSDFDSVHIVSHGSPGTLYLGNDELSLSTLSQHAHAIREWFKNSSQQASLYLYGCNVAAGDAGSEFVEKLTQLTEADIYASANLVGNSNLGGTWNLKGRETARLAFSANAQAAYSHTLARVLTNGGFEDGVTVLAAPGFLVTDEANVPGWETNNAEGALTDDLELWIDGFNPGTGAIAAPEGNQFMEMNSNGFVVLSQDLDVLAGDVISYSFFHRGRDGDETIQLEIGDEIITTETTGAAFVEYTGTYTYMGAAGTLPLIFRSIVPANGDAGQLLDDISIDFAPRIEFAAATNAGDENVGDDIPQLLIFGTFTAAGSVDVTVTGGTATAGTDFTNTVTVDIAAGTYTAAAPVAINLDVLGDTGVELDETIEFTLSNATGGNNNATAIIADVDGDAVIQTTNTYTILNDDDVVVDPTDPPVDPTDPPVDPTDPPVDPTDPPVDPTDPNVNIDVDITVLTIDADIFVGTVDVDFIRGLDGDDNISGGDANDFVAGNKGDDNISGGNGDDVIRGRRDNDICRGNDGDDEVYGDRGDDRLFGNAGDDFVKGGVGKDRIKGGDGNDELIGNGGNDRIVCGSGDDSVIGGFGSDLIKGGAGSDVFHYRGFGDGGDRITDFQVGVDVLDITQIVVRFGLEANATILDDYIQFEQRGSRTVVFLDADGIDGGRSRSALTVLQSVEVTSIGAASFEFG